MEHCEPFMQMYTLNKDHFSFTLQFTEFEIPNKYVFNF